MLTTTDLFQKKEKWEQGRFYTKEELANVDGPTDPRWMLTQRPYYGELMYVYIFKNDYYPETEMSYSYESDSDTEDGLSDDEGYFHLNNIIPFEQPEREAKMITISPSGKEWYQKPFPIIDEEGKIDDTQSFGMENLALVPYESEIHPFPLDAPLTGGVRTVKFHRSYIIKGRAHDLLTCKLMSRPQFCTKWAVEVTLKTDYDLDAMLTESDNGIVVKFKNNFCRIVSRNSTAEVQISVNSSDMAAATFDVTVEFILEGAYSDTAYNPRATVFDSSYGYCFNGVFESGRYIYANSLISSGQCYFPIRIRRKVWQFLRRFYERIVGWVDVVENDTSILRLWLEGNFYLVSLIFSEIKKYSIFLSAQDGVAVTCLQHYSLMLRKRLEFPFYQNPTTLRVDLHELTEMPAVSLQNVEDRTWTPVRVMGPIDDYYDKYGVIFKSDQVSCYGDDMMYQAWDLKSEYKT